MTSSDGAESAKQVSQSELQEKVDDAWDYHETLKEREQNAVREGDEVGAAYFAGQASGLLHMIEVLESLAGDEDG